LASFRFRLQASLKIADQALQQSRQRLAEELQTLKALQLEERICRIRLLDALQGKREASQSHPADLGKWQTYTQQCEQSLRMAQARTERQEEEVSKARETVLEANREVEKLKRLKEKQWAAFLEEQQRKEQKILDETGQILYQLQQKEVIS
jgi:flagellar FliJ protein